MPTDKDNHRVALVINLPNNENCIQISQPSNSICWPSPQQEVVLSENEAAMLFGRTSVLLSPEASQAILHNQSPNMIVLDSPVDEDAEKLDALEKQVGELRDVISTHDVRLDSLQVEVQPVIRFFIKERKRLAAATEKRVQDIEKGDAASACDGKLLIFADGFTLIRDQEVKVENTIAMTVFALARSRSICSYHEIAKALYGDKTPVPSADRKRRIKSYVSKARGFLKSHKLKCEIESYRGQGWVLKN